MASVVVTLKIMPASPDTDLHALEHAAKKKISHSTGMHECKVAIEPIAFGLKAIKLTFLVDEEKGSTDALEHEISQIDGVNSVEVTDVRRALG